jgi:hypothetical protein
MGWSKQKRIPYGESVFCRFAPRPYQMPDAIRTTAHAPVNRIKNGEGNMNQATTAAAAESPPLT